MESEDAIYKRYSAAFAFERVQLDPIIRNTVTYTTLSHRWGEEEPAYSVAGTLEGQGPGYEKLDQFLKASMDRGIMFAWADTCCIDKGSSAELDEAIRSMFHWYENSTLCLVHLAQTSGYEDMDRDEWFERGWTLQELLAPPRVKFFDKNWIPLTCHANDKSSRRNQLIQKISTITGISEQIFIGTSQSNAIFSVPINERIAWATYRFTTRVEDAAYSLMGMMRVSIQTAYGEGWGKSFRRLFEAIVQEGTDPSVL
ncbi:HET-domain-containing protein, partial [Coniophora puteana RWD-64-598 SS2]